MQNVFRGAVIALVAMICAVQAIAQSVDKPSFVVALDKLDGTGFERTVMLAVPYKDQHVGLVLNKPSPYTLAQLFPDHGPSKAAKSLVYLGGGQHRDALFAVTRAEASPGKGSLELMPGVWLVIDGATIDKVIEDQGSKARYFLGAIVWPVGGLAKEVSKGDVAIRPADPAKLFGDPSKLYDEIVPKGRKPAVET